jgi:hypothetical protein
MFFFISDLSGVTISSSISTGEIPTMRKLFLTGTSARTVGESSRYCHLRVRDTGEKHTVRTLFLNGVAT